MDDRHDEDESQSQLERLKADKDFPTIQALIGYLRAHAARWVPTAEIAGAIGRRKGQVYALIKKARSYLSLTSGEAIGNIRSVGYHISSNPRLFLFESIKSGNRADGHLGQEGINFRRVNTDLLKTAADRELYVQQRARIRLGEARLALSNDIKPVMRALEENMGLVDRAQVDALTPWEELGLEDPNGRN